MLCSRPATILGIRYRGMRFFSDREVEGEVASISQQGTITMIDPDDRQKRKEYEKGPERSKKKKVVFF